MAHIKIAKKYELKYWRVHKDKPYSRAEKMMELFDWPDSCNSAADIGSGPRGGIFHVYKVPIMYAVDPLWKSYKQNKLDKIPKGVITLTAAAEHFTLPKPVDLAISINALDHSGSLEDSIHNIMRNVRKRGRFFFHVHMRTKKQLNKGHRMLVTESEIDDIFSSYTQITKHIYDICPLDLKPYCSYVAMVQK